VAELQLGRVFDRKILAGRCQLPQAGKTVGRDRVGARERIPLGIRVKLLAGKALECRQHAETGLLRGVEVRQTGLVGSRLLRAALCRQAAHNHLVATHHDALPGAAYVAAAVATGDGASDHGADAEKLDQQGARLVLGDATAQSRHVSAGDVAGFVCEDADHFIRRIRLHKRAGVHEDVAAIDDEGVEGVVVDDAHRDAPGTEPRGLEDLLRVVVEESFDFRVADERQALRGCLASEPNTRCKRGQRARDRPMPSVLRLLHPVRANFVCSAAKCSRDRVSHDYEIARIFLRSRWFVPCADGS
jgi:hypothetical protein